MRIFALVGALALSALALPDAALAQTRPQLTIGISQFPPNLHPSIDPTVAKTYVHGVARRFLTHYSADWKIVCGLCTEVPSLENGKAKIVDRPGGGKGIAVTFTLKPGLKWADGAPLTTKDIAFSLEAGKRADLGFNNPDLYDAMEKIDVVDASTFVIHFNKIRYDFDSLADFTILPEHIEGPIYRAVTDPKEYGRNSAFNRAPTTAGLYNGPYRITQVETGQFIRFERNEHWIGERPAFDRIIIRTIENTSALEQNLLSGDVDYVAGELGLSFDQALALQKRASDKFNFVFESSLIYEHIDLNLDNPALADKRVRQALLMAIDRETLVQKLFEGRQPVAHSWVHPKDAGYDPNVKKYPFDPAAARKLGRAGGTGLTGNNKPRRGRRLRNGFVTQEGAGDLEISARGRCLTGLRGGIGQQLGGRGRLLRFKRLHLGQWGGRRRGGAPSGGELRIAAVGPVLVTVLARQGHHQHDQQGHEDEQQGKVLA